MGSHPTTSRISKCPKSIGLYSQTREDGIYLDKIISHHLILLGLPEGVCIFRSTCLLLKDHQKTCQDYAKCAVLSPNARNYRNIEDATTIQSNVLVSGHSFRGRVLTHRAGGHANTQYSRPASVEGNWAMRGCFRVHWWGLDN